MPVKSAYKEIVRPVPNSRSVFVYIEAGKGFVLPAWKDEWHALWFVLNGDVKMTGPDGQSHCVTAGHFVLIPRTETWKKVAGCDAGILIWLFDRVDRVWTSVKIRKLLEVRSGPAQGGGWSLPVRRPLTAFLDLLVLYTEEKEIDRSFYASKDSELLSLLYACYQPEELGNMFYPVLRTNPDFKSFVEANYLKVESAAELAELMGCSQVTLNRKFREYYNDTAYQWIIKNKKGIIKKRLQTSSNPLFEIAKEFGFYSGSELNRFCRRHFGLSALKLRKQAGAEEQD